MQRHDVEPHGASVEAEEGARLFKCLQCSKAFSLQSHPTIHVQGHNIESHGVHTETHEGGKPYKCPQCPGSFGWSTSPAIHTQVHTGEEPYKC